MSQNSASAKVDALPAACATAVVQGGAATPTEMNQVNCELAQKIAALMAQVETLTTKVTELSTQKATAAVAATGQTGVPTYKHPNDSIRHIPPDFTIGKTNIIDAWRMWQLGNKRCGAG